MSAILSADDLNDFISPGVACIKPIETLPAKAEDTSVRLFRNPGIVGKRMLIDTRTLTKSPPRRRPQLRNRLHPHRFRLQTVLPAPDV